MSDRPARASDLMKRLPRLGAAIDPGLTDRDVERLIAGARRRRRRRTVTHALLGAAAAAGAAAIVAVRLAGPAASPIAARPGARDVAARAAGAAGKAEGLLSPPPAPPTAAPDRPLRLSDGSVATLLDARAALAVVQDSARRVSLNLDGGRARFDVVHNPQRFFSVHAGDVTVSVLGTQFTVERVADRVGVAVERGTVRVDWGVGSRLLRVGESGWFPPLVVGESAPPRRPAPATTAAAAGKPGAGGPGAGALSRASGAAVAGAPATGDRAAPARFEPAPTPTAEALLAAADAARMRGQADQAEALLRRLLRQRRDDPRAPLAAFTLGRLLLMELGRPRDAAAAFAEVRVLAPGGPFAEDALAREVEAWSKAKEPDKARAKGEEYLRSYPRGMRVEAVRSFSGRP